MQIQQALRDKGFYTGPVNGDWGPDSIAALKRFQADQKLTPDGKLGALSLIALGLGPNRDTIADVAARPATEPPAGP
jgi:peptidoglycan hydrolase-like protein with peptidoglycan-binding domain